MNGRNKDIREKRKTKDNRFAKNAPLKPASLRRISIEPEAVHVLSRQKRQQCSSFNEILKRERSRSTYVPSTSRPKSTSTCLLLFPFPYEKHQWQKQGQIRKNNNKGQQFGNKRRTSETALLRRISMKLKDVHAFSTTASITLASALTSSSTNRSSPRPYRSHGAARRPFFACVLSRRIRICKSVEHVAQRLQRAELFELR
jgi:hypothetical protein